MGQQISSVRLSSLFSWPGPESDPPGEPFLPCQCPTRAAPAELRPAPAEHRPVATELRPAPRRRPVRRRLSLSSADDNPKKSRRNFDLSCFKSDRKSVDKFECCSNHSGSFTSLRSRSKRKLVSRCSKSQDRETTFTMSTCNQFDDKLNADCVSLGCVRNESDSGLSNACASTSSSNRVEDDIQNGNEIEVDDQFDVARGCTKSSSIDRYMSAITDRVDRTHLNECGCDCNEVSKSNSLKSRKNRGKMTNSKSCTKQLDQTSTGVQECFGCGNKDHKDNKTEKSSKTKRWVSKFYGSKVSKNAKLSGNGTNNRSTDSGLDIAGSSNDPSCVCTLYRKVDEPCRFSQSSDMNHLTLGFARDRANWPRAPATVTANTSSANIAFHRHGELSCEGSHCHESVTNQQPNQQSSSFNIANLPSFNITVTTRVALAHRDTVYGEVQGQPNRVYHTIRGNGVYSDLNGVYGTFQNANGSQSIQLVTEDGGNNPRHNSGGEGNVILLSVGPQNTPVIDIRWTAEQDCEERARIRRAWEIFEGVEPPPGYRPHIQVIQSPGDLRTLLFQQQKMAVQQTRLPPRIHTQVDFIHCLVPDLRAINNCSFYWGKMDRYEAERLLEAKPEGTFLLRDSAQEEYLFSVSFRKYGRSLHARIEQFNHKFSFDSHDPGVYAASTVTGLIEHYKDPACVMFFEPMLTAPLSRTHAFPLQHLCRAVVASSTTYDGINELRLPQTMKAYLKEYHYRQRVRVKRFDGPPPGLRWEPEGLMGSLADGSDERQ